MGDNLRGDGIMRIVLLTIALLVFLPSSARAQQSGVRLASADGSILVPVASNVLCSDERMHLNRGSVQAWDICAPKGTPIYPMADGVVEYAGSNNAGGYGTWVCIDHGNGIHSVMAHFMATSLTVRSGERVTKWDVVGRVGWTDFAAAVVLEDEFGLNSGGKDEGCGQR